MPCSVAPQVFMALGTRQSLLVPPGLHQDKLAPTLNTRLLLVLCCPPVEVMPFLPSLKATSLAKSFLILRYASCHFS